MISEEWDSLNYKEKNTELYYKQKQMLEGFLKRGAISRQQFEKSLHDLTEKTGMKPEGNSLCD